MFKKLLLYFLIAITAYGFFANSKIEFKFLKKNQEFDTPKKPQYALECHTFARHSDFDKASQCFKQALRGNEGNAEIRYYLALSMFLDKNYSGAMFHSDFIAKNIPSSPYFRPANKLYDVAKQAQDEKKNLENSGSVDYLHELQNIRMWGKMPVKVWIQHSDNNTNLRNAFYTWQTALYPTVSFQMVKNRDDANLIVVFEGADRACGNANAVGCSATRIWNNTKKLADAVIYLNYVTPSGKKVSDAELYSTLIHEIGHAIGIDGHSSNKSDIMYPDTSNYNRRPTRRDVNTVRRIYGRR